MTYVALNALFLGVALAVAVVAWASRRLSRRMIAAAAVELVVVLALTAVFDNMMIAAGLFTYDPDRILGLKLGLAPVEDFGYPLAAAILLPSLWALCGRQEGYTDD